MARFSLSRVPRTPPYVVRSEQDRAIFAAAERPAGILFVLGEGEERGVSRTVRRFLSEAPDSRFRESKTRHPVVIDFCGPQAALHPILQLVGLRNALVHSVNSFKFLPKLGFYLFSFDVLYKLWLSMGDANDVPQTPLMPTAAGKLRRLAVKLVVHFSGVGAVNMLGDAAEVAGVVKHFGWEAEGLIDLGRSEGLGHVYHKNVGDLERFTYHLVHPWLNPMLKKAIGNPGLNSEAICMLMTEILADAIVRVQEDIEGHGRLMLFADAIDEAGDDKVNSVSIRFALITVMNLAQSKAVAPILCGRAPSAAWIGELNSPTPPNICALADLSPVAIRNAFKHAGLKEALIDNILQMAGAPSPISAGRLSQVCQRLQVQWPPR